MSDDADERMRGVKMSESVVVSELYFEDGNFTLLFVTPEAVATNETLQNRVKKLVEKKQLSLVCIDEVHCLSTWGKSFRRSYRQLGTLQSMVPANVPWLLLSATITPKIRDDILSVLSLKPEFIYASPDLRVLVTTKAFGMGIQIDDVINVIHWGPSSDVLSYWQEVGRCGRGCKPGNAYLYSAPRSALACNTKLAILNDLSN
eukprot:XP_011680820.1 PREDICTED: ATP-dependent DNA helicase Q5-like [Strongylocentrotus purpuratus]